MLRMADIQMKEDNIKARQNDMMNGLAFTHRELCHINPKNLKMYMVI